MTNYRMTSSKFPEDFCRKCWKYQKDRNFLKIKVAREIWNSWISSSVFQRVFDRCDPRRYGGEQLLRYFIHPSIRERTIQILILNMHEKWVSMRRIEFRWRRNLASKLGRNHIKIGHIWASSMWRGKRANHAESGSLDPNGSSLRWVRAWCSRVMDKDRDQYAAEYQSRR